VKALLVDIDPVMLLRCVTRVRGRQPLAVATSKKQAMEMLGATPGFEVVVACERLEDGTGLALLDEVHAKWPDMIRVFCAERQRLSMVRPRLSAFRLRYTLTYPLRSANLELLLLKLAQDQAAATIRLPPRPA
jgi:predicted pyridoxine 5'-phosphate oxidase superfamily flavin-nucleotide-binding protein